MRQLVSSAGRKSEERRGSIKSKVHSNLLDVKNSKDGSANLRGPRSSMIPKLKLLKNEEKEVQKKPKSPSPSKSELPRNSGESPAGKHIGESYSKIEDFIYKVLESSEEPEKDPNAASSSARKMISDTLVLNKGKYKQDFGNSNVQDGIPPVWLATTTDLSDVFKILEDSSVSEPAETEPENTKIQKGVKHARSLTLVKTRNMIEEAKELILRRMLIRKEIEKLIWAKEQYKEEDEEKKEEREIKKDDLETDDEDERTGKISICSVDDSNIPSGEDKSYQSGYEVSCPSTEGRSYLSGDDRSYHVGENLSGKTESMTSKTKEKEIENKKNKVVSHGLVDSVNLGKSSYPEKDVERQTPSLKKNRGTSTQNMMDFCAAEIARKNETITQLNSKIFELQKARTESTLKCGQLQGKLAEFQGNIQWIQVLWKQIGKLKDKINGLQENNAQLESQKRELEFKLGKLDSELERVMTLNQTLNKKRFSLILRNSGESLIGSERSLEANSTDLKKKVETGERILAEKQGMIDQLMAILNQMKEQEVAAQKQIYKFKSKIEELEKNSLL